MKGRCAPEKIILAIGSFKKAKIDREGKMCPRGEQFSRGKLQEGKDGQGREHLSLGRTI
jgi:hypothetical protein